MIWVKNVTGGILILPESGLRLGPGDVVEVEDGAEIGKAIAKGFLVKVGKIFAKDESVCDETPVPAGFEELVVREGLLNEEVVSFLNDLGWGMSGDEAVQDLEDRVVISDFNRQITIKDGVARLSFKYQNFVFSKYDEVFEVFAKSFLENIGKSLIVLDDGLSSAIKKKFPFKYIPMPQPFAFCRAVNKCFDLARTYDVLILNDDIVIKTKKLDFRLARAAYAYPDVALSTPVMEGALFPENIPANKTDEWVKKTTGFVACFGCGYIKRLAIESAGYVDEQFAEGVAGCEDIDYMQTLKVKGWKFAVANRCLVEHGGPAFGPRYSVTRFKSGLIDSGVESKNREYLFEKWPELRKRQ